MAHRNRWFYLLNNVGFSPWKLAMEIQIHDEDIAQGMIDLDSNRWIIYKWPIQGLVFFHVRLTELVINALKPLRWDASWVTAAPARLRRGRGAGDQPPRRSNSTVIGKSIGKSIGKPWEKSETPGTSWENMKGSKVVQNHMRLHDKGSPPTHRCCFVLDYINEHKLYITYICF